VNRLWRLGILRFSLAHPWVIAASHCYNDPATGHAAFAGSAEAAFKATDSTTGQLLAESVDRRIGGMAVKEVAQIQWGDAEAAMDYWSQKITERALALGAGNPIPTGQSSTSG